MSHWEAPRVAYELAADWAERFTELTARHGDAGGQLADPPEIGKAWHDLAPGERRDVMEALASQARAGLWEVTKQTGMGLVISEDNYVHCLCERAADAIFALIAPDGPGEWAMPECSHCAAVMATFLANLQFTAIRCTGIADPAAVIRNLADGSQVPPQREAGHDA